MSQKRHATNEKLMAATREQIPTVAIPWLAAVRKPLEKLTKAALSGKITNEQFATMVQEFSESLPGLLEKMDTAPLAELLETGMGAAMANGITARQNTLAKAKLPWETDAWLAGRKIKRKADGKFATTDEARTSDSRNQLRRKPTLKEKKQASAQSDAPKDAAIDRYRKGVSVDAPTGRKVVFGNRVADHLASKSEQRGRFADQAEKTVKQPDEVFQDGMRVRYLKNPRQGGKNKFLVVARQTSESEEEVISFMKQSSNKKKPPGKRIYPAE
jgi:hypothetical protein